MKFKLDQNLGRRAEQLLLQRGHDVMTVADEQLCSASDETLISTCRRERRCLVTLDLDFGNPLVFRPSEYPGIAGGAYIALFAMCAGGGLRERGWPSRLIFRRAGARRAPLQRTHS